MLCADRKGQCKSNLSTASVLANRDFCLNLMHSCIRIWCTAGAVEWWSQMFVHRLSLFPSPCYFFTLSPNREPVHRLRTNDIATMSERNQQIWQRTHDIVQYQRLTFLECVVTFNHQLQLSEWSTIKPKTYFLAERWTVMMLLWKIVSRKACEGNQERETKEPSLRIKSQGGNGEPAQRLDSCGLF